MFKTFLLFTVLAGINFLVGNSIIGCMCGVIQVGSLIGFAVEATEDDE